jgi:uncharacterized membrane protein
MDTLITLLLIFLGAAFINKLRAALFCGNLPVSRGFAPHRHGLRHGLRRDVVMAIAATLSWAFTYYLLPRRAAARVGLAALWRRSETQVDLSVLSYSSIFS